MNQFISLFKTVFNYVIPYVCAFCKKLLQSDTVLCFECSKKIQPVVSKNLTVTPSKQLTVLALGSYKDPLRSMILAKARSDKTMAVLLGRLLWEQSYIKNCAFDLIVPIPLHWTRYAWRGYNQAQVIANHIAKKSGKPVVNVLYRKRYTPFLSKVPLLDRGLLMKEIFAIHNGEQIRGKKILLVDDLMTTGVTLKSAARELYKKKPASIIAGVVARVT